MKTHLNPFKTTIRGLQNSANVVAVVRRIQNKIIDRGIISERESEYLRQHTDWDRVNPRTASNLG